MTTPHARAYIDHLTRERRPPNTIAAARRTAEIYREELNKITQ